MQSVKQLHDIRGRRSTSYSFVHLTLQEYLAALHWSQLPPLKLSGLLQQEDLFPIHQYLRGIHLKKEEEESLQVIHWPVLLFLAGLTRYTSIPPELITPWTGLPGDEEIKFHPSLCQLLFETQSPQLVSTVFSGRRVMPDSDKMKSPLDWFATGYCITHSNTTISWRVKFDTEYHHTSQCLQMFSNGLHYSSTMSQRNEGTGSLNELTLYVFRDVSQYLEIFPSVYPYTQAITSLWLGDDLHSDDHGVPVLQQLSHYCPRLRELILPRLHPPYLSLVPQLPQHILVSLRLTLPLMKNDSVLGHQLQQCQALKQLALIGVDK